MDCEAATYFLLNACRTSVLPGGLLCPAMPPEASVRGLKRRLNHTHCAPRLQPSCLGRRQRRVWHGEGQVRLAGMQRDSSSRLVKQMISYAIQAAAVDIFHEILNADSIFVCWGSAEGHAGQGGRA